MKYWMLVVCFAMGLLGSGIGQCILSQTESVQHWSGAEYYEDVSADSPHAEDIGFAREAGVARGFSNTQYGPGSDVSREQMATFEMRDMAAAIIFTLRISGRLYDDVYGVRSPLLPPTSMGLIEEWEYDIAFCRWMADLIEQEMVARTSDAIGGPDLYADYATHLRAWADLWESELPYLEARP